MPRTSVIFAAMLILGGSPAYLAVPAQAQAHDHAAGRKGPNGGSLQDVAGLEAELVVKDGVISVHLFDEAGKPVAAAGHSGSVLVGAGQARQVIQLTAGASNSLSGNASTAVRAGTSVTLQLKAPTGKTGQARYTT